MDENLRKLERELQRSNVDYVIIPKFLIETLKTNLNSMMNYLMRKDNILVSQCQFCLRTSSTEIIHNESCLGIAFKEFFEENNTANRTDVE